MWDFCRRNKFLVYSSSVFDSPTERRMLIHWSLYSEIPFFPFTSHRNHACNLWKLHRYTTLSGKIPVIAFSSDCWQSIMKLPTVMLLESHCARNSPRASAIQLESSCWTTNSAITEYPTFVLTTRKKRGSDSLHVLYVASIKTRFGYL